MLTVFLISCSILQYPAAGPRGEEPFLVDVGCDRGTFLVAQPDAPESAALRLNDDLAAKSGAVPPPTAGWRLAGRLIVRTKNAALLAAIAGDFGAHGVAPLGALSDFWLVDAGSVRAALRLREALAPVFGAAEVYLDAARPLAPRGLPDDPGFTLQWHLYNSASPIADANVRGAWDAGHVGQGVVIGVTDSGVYEVHPDLAPNYNAAASQAGAGSNHGTSCAGIAAAAEGNGQGGVGAAYGAQWSKQHYGFASQNVAAFGFANQINDVKTNSWGPADDGALKHMTSAERAALEDAAQNGRGGLGVVFFWAAGNGGASDRVDYDPYASSRFTIAVGAITDGDSQAAYSESGSAMFAAGQSDGGSRGIYTTDGPGNYTSGFGGTSAASPLAAGVGALILSANPALSWRDVQHLLVETARQCDAGDPSWIPNGSGRAVSERYGFGALNAAAAAGLAAAWTPVGAPQEHDTGVQTVNQPIPDNQAAGLTRTVDVAPQMVVETVELIVNADHDYVGDLEIELTSPAGTSSLLSKKRLDPQDDLTDYLFTAFRCWGEGSAGTWTVRIADRGANAAGVWLDFRLRIHGYDGSGGAGGASHLTSGTILAGAPAHLMLTQAVPNAAAWLAGSGAGPGSTYLGALGVTLDLAAPFRIAGPTLTDAAGSLSWHLPVPIGAAGKTYYVQAAQAGKVSNVLTGVVQ